MSFTKGEIIEVFNRINRIEINGRWYMPMHYNQDGVRVYDIDEDYFFTWDELKNAKFYELVEIIPSSQE